MSFFSQKRGIIIALCAVVVLIGSVAVAQIDIQVIRGQVVFDETCDRWVLERPKKGERFLTKDTLELTPGSTYTVLGKKQLGYGDNFTQCNPPSFISVIGIWEW